MSCIALQELLNLDEVILLGQLNGLIPLIKEHTTINSFLNVTKLDVSSNSSCAESHRLETFS